MPRSVGNREVRVDLVLLAPAQSKATLPRTCGLCCLYKLYQYSNILSKLITSQEEEAVPFNQSKTTTLNDFLAAVCERLKPLGPNAVTFFEFFGQKDLARKLVERCQADSRVGEMDLNAGDFDVIYQLMVKELRDAAGRAFSEVHPETYDTAHTISGAICAELNEYFECSGPDGTYDLIPVKSYIEMVSGSPTSPQ